MLNRNWMKQMRAKTLPRLGNSMKEIDMIEKKVESEMRQVGRGIIL